MTLTNAELRAVLTFTIQLARTAGTLILEGSQAIQASTQIDEKKNAVDLVTQYDVAVEELVRAEIAKTYPGFGFIGEESYSAGKRPELTDEPTFCVDPIDGTTNFVHGFPFACISLGLIVQKRPVMGVIFNPFLDHLYTALEGQGAFLTRGNAPPLKLPLSNPKPLPSLQKALLAIEWGSDRGASVVQPKADSFTRLAGDGNDGVAGGRMAHSLRSVGSAALNFALVAQGALDMYWEIGCWPWDVCAGIVIAQEAGGAVTGSHAIFNAASATGDSAAAFNVTPDVLYGRKYLVVRNIAGAPNESGRDAQLRIAKEFYETVEDVEPK
ncbi:myo inositol monophosphatase [Coniophora puteana RWD-64-598 SS2]|uniref:Inositol-1-monophosphatase n=1 Tax=Coniophora puteana (strain RWD-64-598) TaxID=741705 RepID=A0A5M3N722_CONPW|nr:myo inositol monophosphatase [Coniophora puteana RWD-64-598 SS2]EIW87239.1 myo inositol monophosphatase [Coniophora puteana RWD-64-598 SS2]